MTVTEGYKSSNWRRLDAVENGQRYWFADLVDIAYLERLFKSFSAASGYAIAVIAHPEQKLIVGTGFRKVCDHYHRVCSVSDQRCLIHGAIAVDRKDSLGEPAIERCCLGLVQGAIPIIINDSHIATLVAGGVFFEPPDVAHYAAQAQTFGFETRPFLDAIGEIPVVREEAFRKTLSFLYDMAALIAALALNNLREQSAAQAPAKEIDERKRAQNKIEESDQKYRVLIENAGFPIVYFDKSGRVTYISNSAATYMGMTPDQLVGKTFFDFLPAEQAEPYWKIFQNCLTKHEDEFIENRVPLLQGGVWFRSSVHTVRDARGEAIGVQAVCMNIEDRKRAEQELERLRNFLSNVVDLMPSVLVVVNGEGHVTQWNRQAEKATGITFVQAQGRVLAEVFPALQGQMDKIQTAMATGQAETDERATLSYRGETILGQVTVYPLTSDGVAGAVIRIDDITERARLEEMVIQTEKMLSIGGLAAGIAHEIFNPLSGVLQSLEVITRRLKSDLPQNRLTAQACGTDIATIEEYMERRGILSLLLSASESGRRAAKIVDNMLGFSRKTEGKFRLHEMSALLDTTMEIAASDYELEERYDFGRIQIVREYEPNVPKVWCDVSKIQQVFFNLIKNSAQALVEGVRALEEPRITLRLKSDNEMVRVEVEDNGYGMEEGVRRRVFEPYFTTKEVGVGTGLGLSISYFIITETHRGSMSVESTIGVGTKFIIRLPIRES
jgi:PAS domain S-box-containing protein